jgi:hypothetical protein
MKIWGLVTDKEDNKLKGYTLKLWINYTLMSKYWDIKLYRDRTNIIFKDPVRTAQ